MLKNLIKPSLTGLPIGGGITPPIDPPIDPPVDPPVDPPSGEFPQALIDAGAAAYRMTDSNLFQDLAKTTVAGVGDPVRVIEAMGSAAPDIFVPEGAEPGGDAPVLRQDAGGNLYLERQFTDGQFETASSSGAQGGFSYHTAFMKTADWDPNGINAPNLFRETGGKINLFISQSDDELNLKSDPTGSEERRAVLSGANALFPTNQIKIASFEVYQDVNALLIDGAEVASTYSDNSTLDGWDNGFRAFRGTQGRIYALAVVPEPQMGPETRHAVEAWLNARAGNEVTLAQETYWGFDPAFVHRGIYAPGAVENTGAAFTGVPDGLGWEVDIQRDLEGVFWCYHDDTLNSQTDGVGFVGANTTAQMAAARYNNGGEPILRYTDFLDMAVARGAGLPALTIELKDAGDGSEGWQNDRWSEALAEITTRNLEAKSDLQTKHDAAVTAILAANSVIKVARAKGANETFEEGIDAGVAFNDARVSVNSNQNTFTNESRAQSLLARAGSTAITVYTPETQLEINRLFSFGVRRIGFENSFNRVLPR